MMLRGVRWVLVAALLGAGLLYYRFGYLNILRAGWFQMYIGYYAVLGVLAWWGWSFWQSRDALVAPIRADKKAWTIDLLVILGLSLLLHVHEPHTLRVLNDEPSHVAGSLLMHQERMAVMPGKVHYFFGSPINLANFPSFRLYLFQVLLSFIHDATGYRPENVFILNGLLTVALLGLVYAVGRVFAGRRGGLLGCILLVSLPLLAQNVTSGGYDVLNMVLIAGLFLASYHYLRSPGVEGLDLMVSTGVLLALSRYESIVYLLVPVGAALAKWSREKAIALTPMAVISPVLLLPCMAANYIMMNTDAFTLKAMRGGEYDFFNIKYLYPHLADAFFYVFSWDNNGTNSPLLGLVGLVSVFAMMLLLPLRARRQPTAPKMREWLLLGVLLVTMGLYALTLTNFWGMPSDAMASRFILPMHLMFALTGVWFMNECWNSRRLPGWLVAVAAVYVWQFTIPANSKHTATDMISGGRNAEWFVDYARKHDRGRTLYVMESDIPAAIHQYPSIQTSVFNTRINEACQVLQAKIYEEILFVQHLWISPFDGTIHFNHGTPIAHNVVTEFVAEHKFSPDQLVRIVRFKGVRSPDGKVLTPAEVSPLPTKFKNIEEMTRYLFDKLP
jgi:hypothetical protein